MDYALLAVAVLIGLPVAFFVLCLLVDLAGSLPTIVAIPLCFFFPWLIPFVVISGIIGLVAHFSGAEELG